MSIQWVYPSKNNVYGGSLIREKAVRRLSLNAGVLFDNHLKATVISEAIHLSSGILYADGYFIEINARTFPSVPNFFAIGVDIQKDELGYITNANLDIYDCSNNPIQPSVVILYHGYKVGQSISIYDARNIIGLDAITYSKYKEGFIVSSVQNLSAIFSDGGYYAKQMKSTISQNGNAIIINTFGFITLEAVFGVSNTNVVEATFSISGAQATQIRIRNGYSFNGIAYSGLVKPSDYVTLTFSEQPNFTGPPIIYITTYEIGGAYGF